MTSPTTDPSHIDCAARIARAQHVAADAIKRAEVLEAERDEWRTLAKQLRVERDRMSGALCDASDVPSEPLEGLQALIKQRDALRTQLAARPSAAPLDVTVDGCTVLLAGHRVTDFRIAADAHALADSLRSVLRHVARPAAESVAVPPVDAEALARRWLVEHYYKPNAITGDVRDWMNGLGGRVDGDVADSLEATAAFFRAHWPRAVSSEEVERLRAEVPDVDVDDHAPGYHEVVIGGTFVVCSFKLHAEARHLADRLSEWLAANWRSEDSKELDLALKALDKEIARREAAEAAVTAARAQGAAEERAACAKLCEQHESYLRTQRDPAAYDARTLSILIRARESARAAAAGAETSDAGTRLDPGSGSARLVAVERQPLTPEHAPVRGSEETGTSPPPCAACGGKGILDHCGGCEGTRCPACTGHAPPPASSKAGEDDAVNALCDDVRSLRGERAAELARRVLSLVRSERRRARRDLADEASDLIEARRKAVLADKNDPSWTEHFAELANDVRALGGEEG